MGSTGLKATALPRNLWTITSLGSRLCRLLTGAEFDTAPRKCRKKMHFLGHKARIKGLKGRFGQLAVRNRRDLQFACCSAAHMITNAPADWTVGSPARYASL